MKQSEVAGWRRLVPKSRRGVAVMAVGAVAVAAALLVGGLWAAGVVSFPRVEAWLGMGDDGGGEVLVSEPASGSRVVEGSTIVGSATAPGRVYVWVEGVNFAVPVHMDGSAWTYTYAGGLAGERTLKFSVAAPGGSWGAPTSVSYEFSAAGEAAGSSGTPFSDSLPGVVRSVFRPIERGMVAAVAFVNSMVSGVTQGPGGAGSGDLDGNGVSDRWQGSPVSPADGVLGRVPYVNLALLVLAALALVAGVYVAKGQQIHAFVLKRQGLRVEQDRLRARVAEKRLGALERLKARQIEAVRDVRRKQLEVTGQVQRSQLTAAGAAHQERLRTIRELKGKELDLRMAAAGAVPEDARRPKNHKGGQ